MHNFLHQDSQQRIGQSLFASDNVNKSMIISPNKNILSDTTFLEFNQDSFLNV